MGTGQNEQEFPGPLQISEQGRSNCLISCLIDKKV